MKMKWVGWKPIDWVMGSAITGAPADVATLQPCLTQDRAGEFALYSRPISGDSIWRSLLPEPRQPIADPIYRKPTGKDLYTWGPWSEVRGKVQGPKVDGPLAHVYLDRLLSQDQKVIAQKFLFARGATHDLAWRDRVLVLSGTGSGDPNDVAWREVPGNGVTDASVGACCAILRDDPANFQTIVYVFARGIDDQGIYVQCLDANSGAWDAWREVPGGGKTSSAPACTRLDAGDQSKVYVFVRGTDDAPWFITGRGTGPSMQWQAPWKRVPDEGYPLVTGLPIGVASASEYIFVCATDREGTILFNLHRDGPIAIDKRPRGDGGALKPRWQRGGTVAKPDVAVADPEHVFEPNPWSGWNIIPSEGIRFRTAPSVLAFPAGDGVDDVGCCLVCARDENRALWWNRGLLSRH